jgi:hypothetical protein
MGTETRIVMYQHLFTRFCTLPPKMKRVQWVQGVQKPSNTNNLRGART